MKEKVCTSHFWNRLHIFCLCKLYWCKGLFSSFSFISFRSPSFVILHDSMFRLEKDIKLCYYRQDGFSENRLFFSAGVCMAHKNRSSQAPIWKTIEQEGLEVTCRNRGVACVWMDLIVQLYLYCSNVWLSWGTFQFKKCYGSYYDRVCCQTSPSIGLEQTTSTKMYSMNKVMFISLMHIFLSVFLTVRVSLETLTVQWSLGELRG
jgi:hypothetical protein